MSDHQTDIIVAGHICLDIIPQIPDKRCVIQTLLVPGKLIDVGAAIIATGGAVSNTGLALHKLGSHVRLIGKIGDDAFGKNILRVLKSYDSSLAHGMIVSHTEHTSYTIVISPPNLDRIFLHSTGANDTYTVADLKSQVLNNARVFHFGYPPLMRNMYVRQGEHLVELLKTVKDHGLVVSLDMAKPDPESEAGQANWRTILENTLPYVDIFLPSIEEILYMIYPKSIELWQEESHEALLSYVDGPLLSKLADELITMGAAVVGFKLGEYGLYVRTTAEPKRLASIALCTKNDSLIQTWLGRELFATCFEVTVVGTTGAGDCTIAGFLSGLLHGLTLEEALQMAVGVGACNVEQTDATSGVPTFSQVRRRIADGWSKRELRTQLPDWISINRGLYEKPTCSNINKKIQNLP